MIEYGFHPEASIDIEDIWDFIAADNVNAANKTVDEILGAIEVLVSFPHHGYTRPNLTSRPIRFKPIREYVIAYAPEKKPLWVVAVFHGRRSPRIVAAILRAREQ